MSKAAGNRADYVSKDFDAAMKTAALASDTDEILDSYRDAQRILFTDLPAIPLWYSTRHAGAGDRISSLSFGWDGVPRYWEITKSR